MLGNKWNKRTDHAALSLWGFVLFESISITHVPRGNNYWPNLLSKLTSSNPAKFPVNVWVEVLEKPSVSKKKLVVIPINIENY